MTNFFSDVPDNDPPLARPKPLNKEQLTTAHSLKMQSNFKPIISLAVSITFQRANVLDQAQTVYMLIDDSTPPLAEIDPMLGQAYQALTHAAQLLFEAETHLYRYVNRLENAQREAAELREMMRFVSQSDTDDSLHSQYYADQSTATEPT